MGNRVILGNRGSDYGLFVSQNNEDVTDTTDTTPLAFDARAVRGLTVHAKGEGSLAPAANYAIFTTSTTIAHGLGYTPTVAVRWCYASDLSSGVAQRMYSPAGTAPAEVFGDHKQTIYYAYIIFKAKDFTGGLGL